MRFPSPSHRALGAFDLACAVPLVALAVWFGLIDRLPFGEGRCSSCGVEGYVIGAHVAAAAWLGAVIACAAAARRQFREGIRVPSRATVVALAAVTVVRRGQHALARPFHAACVRGVTRTKALGT